MSGFCLLVFFLAGCPRIASLEVYNNTPEEITIHRYTNFICIKPGQKEQFKFGSDVLKVEFKGSVLYYPAYIPYPAYPDDDAPEDHLSYYTPSDGIFRLQLNVDGLMYALKKGQNPPLLHFPEQLYGYPIKGYEKGDVGLTFCVNEMRKKREEHYERISRRDYSQSPGYNTHTFFMSCLEKFQP